MVVLHLQFHQLVVLVLFLALEPLWVQSQCTRTPIIFNFGDSNSDTGGLVAGLGYNINPPYGRTFFDQSTGRLSDGRLVIDFLCQNLSAPYLSPYMDSLGANFTNGANFAIVGSSTLPKFVPFSLNVQVMQFLHFRARSLELAEQGLRHAIDDQSFHDALYMIDIGQNDLSNAFQRNESYAQVVKKIPLVLDEIKYAVKNLYEKGGKKFWIHNTGPLGCLPQKLSLVIKKEAVFNQIGCVQPYNNAAKLFNEGLHTLCAQLRSEHMDTTIVYVDIYTIKDDLITNSAKYGFESPLLACCGNGGPPYNYNINKKCGEYGFNTCKEGLKYVSWDGVHYTEAANIIVASKILSTAYSTPKVNFDFFCQS